MAEKLVIKLLKTGVPGLDVVLGGGLPEYSFNLIAGAPGSGKTTLSHQIMFHLANPECKAVFFTVLGEPAIKMLRYQQQFNFFDIDKLDSCIKFVNLSSEILNGDFKDVLNRIRQEVQEFKPKLVFVDSFRSVIRATQQAHGQTGMEDFIQQLGMEMTSWQATTFLIGEYHAPESESSPIFTVADGVIWLSQHLMRNSMARKIQVVKMRGQGTRLGLHSYCISSDGIRVFPRTYSKPQIERIPGTELERISMGIPQLDEMLDGGLPKGYSLLMVGPPGVGKTTFATQFLTEGANLGERGIVASFEESSSTALNPPLQELISAGKVNLLDTKSLNLSLDEILHQLVESIRQTGATRIVIDSLSGFEVGLTPEFRENYRDSILRMITTVTGMGATILLTAELEDGPDDLRFSQYGNAFLADALVILRYIEIDSKLSRIIGVVKVRGSNHSKEIRSYEITASEIVIGKVLSGYQGLLTGTPIKVL